MVEFEYALFNGTYPKINANLWALFAIGISFTKSVPIVVNKQFSIQIRDSFESDPNMRKTHCHPTNGTLSTLTHRAEITAKLSR